MDAPAVARRRMRNQRLTGGRLGTPRGVVEHFGAVQSQDFGPAKWSLGQRMGSARDVTVQSAFDAGEVLRTHILRPTWHFVSPADIVWMQELTAPRVHGLNGYSYRQNGLDAATLRKTRKILERNLRDENHLTRKEIATVLERAGIVPTGNGLAHILMNAELELVVCSGPMRGKQHTYALVEERAADAGSLEHSEALRELTRRYFESHGPATERDLRWWSSLTAADVKDGIEMTAGDLGSDVVDGITFWFAHPHRARKQPPPVHLLQTFDEYLVAYRDSKFVADFAGAAAAWFPKGNPSFTGLVVADGQIVGYWKRTLKRDEVTVGVRLDRRPSPELRTSIEEAVSSYGDFLGLPADVSVARMSTPS